MKTLVLRVDADDARDINAAIAVYQRRNHYMGGCLLPDGEGDMAGRCLGEICRGWLEARGELHQQGDDDGE
jgi:hypothetical protein